MAKKDVKKMTDTELSRQFGNAMDNSLSRNEAAGEIQRRNLRNSNIQTISIVVTCAVALVTLIFTVA